MKILFIVMGFASHRTWAEGYVRELEKRKSSSDQQEQQQQHDVRIEIVESDRWKFRMLACTELVDKIHSDDDIVIIDGMFDASLIVSQMMRSGRLRGCVPKVLVYMHENQLTTPFTKQDRDWIQNKHWQYGLCHYRSLVSTDGLIFNSQTHKDQFVTALPKLLNEQSPRSIVQYHLSTCQRLLPTKCMVLPYGLDLQGLLMVDDSSTTTNSIPPPPTTTTALSTPSDRPTIIPTILWNARLEEDKDPQSFYTIIKKLQQDSVQFKLIILGTDPTKEQLWATKFQQEFATELVYIGWCTNRSDYSHWLHKSHIILSTAVHETFGISIVESAYCGVIPVLPTRLSYPELFHTDDEMNDLLFYDKTVDDACRKIKTIFNIIQTDHGRYRTIQQIAKSCIEKYDWKYMCPIYNTFFYNLYRFDHEDHPNDPTPSLSLLPQCEEEIQNEMNHHQSTIQQRQHLSSMDRTLDKYGSSDVAVETLSPTTSVSNNIGIITDPNDDRVQLYRPKSLRNYVQYNQQLAKIRNQYQVEPTVHGGRRAMIRMIEAISLSSTSSCVQPLSFLTTRELSHVLLGAIDKNYGEGDDTTVDANSTKKKKINRLKNVPIYVVETQRVLNEIRGQKLNSGDSILSIVAFPVPLQDIKEVIQSQSPILLLEDVRSAENIGSILRTAYCLGITSIVASPIAWSAIRDTRAARCSMGTIYYHRFFKATSLRDTIRAIQKGGITVYGVEIGDLAKPVRPHGINRKWAAVMGNEDLGLTKAVAAACDYIIFVPQAHGDSLNVGHAAAITLFELGRDGPLPEHDGQGACK
jgi:tRNA G18 (ribose-2'-O)-methylase SpoU/glycosyltransferase involved in cell wall biosynthesis